MLYKPHTLYIKRITVERDEYNRLKESVENWEEICKCRCDDNSVQRFETEEGRVYRPQYHVVCPKNVPIKAGDEVMVANGEDIRGKGKVYNVKHLNYLDYSEIWI